MARKPEKLSNVKRYGLTPRVRGDRGWYFGRKKNLAENLRKELKRYRTTKKTVDSMQASIAELERSGASAFTIAHEKQQLGEFHGYQAQSRYALNTYFVRIQELIHDTHARIKKENPDIPKSALVRDVKNKLLKEHNLSLDGILHKELFEEVEGILKESMF